MATKTTRVNSSALGKRDTAVASILADLNSVVATGDFVAATTRAAEAIRVNALAADSSPLLRGQKSRLIDALARAYPIVYSQAADDAGRLETTAAFNSFATLTLVWAADDPKWTRTSPGALDAASFALAYELEMVRNQILSSIGARHRATDEGRRAIFDELLAGNAPRKDN